MPSNSEIQHLKVTLPPSDKRKVIVFDMDETLIHTVDDITTCWYDALVEMNFDDDEPITAGINIRPHYR
jgi:FMN phosphatase YigB (HAD superfamily)